MAAIYRNATQIFKGKRLELKVLDQGKPNQKEVVIHPGAVVILPLLSENQVVLIRNQRFAVGQELWELPAGTLEVGELPLTTARRELIEETGYRAGKIRKITQFFSTPGFSNEVLYAYIARDLKFVGQSLDDNEKIEVEVLSWKKALKFVEAGIIQDAKTIAVILYANCFLRKNIV